MRTPCFYIRKDACSDIHHRCGYINNKRDFDHCIPGADVSPFLQYVCPFITESFGDQMDAHAFALMLADHLSLGGTMPNLRGRTFATEYGRKEKLSPAKN